jgi:hypothetical protein
MSLVDQESLVKSLTVRRSRLWPNGRVPPPETLPSAGLAGTHRVGAHPHRPARTVSIKRPVAAGWRLGQVSCVS